VETNTRLFGTSGQDERRDRILYGYRKKCFTITQNKTGCMQLSLNCDVARRGDRCHTLIGPPNMDGRCRRGR